MKFIEAVVPAEKEIVVSFKVSELKFIADVLGGSDKHSRKNNWLGSMQRLSREDFEEINNNDFATQFTNFVDKHA